MHFVNFSSAHMRFPLKMHGKNLGGVEISIFLENWNGKRAPDWKFHKTCCENIGISDFSWKLKRKTRTRLKILQNTSKILEFQIFLENWNGNLTRTRLKFSQIWKHAANILEFPISLENWIVKRACVWKFHKTHCENLGISNFSRKLERKTRIRLNISQNTLRKYLNFKFFSKIETENAHPIENFTKHTTKTFEFSIYLEIWAGKRAPVWNFHKSHGEKLGIQYFSRNLSRKARTRLKFSQMAM